ncbi:MAG: ankyrin repeat domain-containing protein [Desulfomonilaceae bacterium]
MSSGNDSNDDRQFLLQELKRLALSGGNSLMKPEASDHPSSDELYDYVLGQLTKDQLPNLMRHISGCPTCNKEVWRIRNFVEETELATLKWADRALEPEEVQAHVIPFSKKSDLKLRRELVKWALPLAAAIALIVLGLGLFNHGFFFETSSDRVAATNSVPSFQLMGPSSDSESQDHPSPASRLLEAASQGNMSLVESLLNDGANINAVDSERRTSLMLAATNGHKMVVLILLKRGADASVKDNDGETAFDLAIKHKHESIAHILRPATNHSNR